jgi:hypothetical protein
MTSTQRPTRSTTARKAANTAARNATQGSGSELASLLERIWAKVQDFAKVYADTDLPTVHMITGSGAMGGGWLRLGHVRPDAWVIAHREGRSHELFVSGETLGRGAESALTTILHEAAHIMLIAQGDETAGTSRQYRYHNGDFRTAGSAFGLEYTHGKANELLGYSALTLSDMGRVLWGAELEALALATATIPAPELVPARPDDPSDDRLTTPKPGRAAGPVRVQRRRITVTCGCRNLAVFADEADDLTCGRCGGTFA